MQKFNIIYADPPWQYRDKALAGNRGSCCKYPVMSQQDLENLPVSNIAADDCILFLWVTMPKLNECFYLIEKWGFEFKTNAFTWVKTNKRKNNSLFWGMGRWTRACSELCLLATKGRPKRISAGVHSVILSPVEKHSKKPDVVRDKIVELCGDLPRIELFARQKVPGWHSIGFDIDGMDVNESIKLLL